MIITSYNTTVSYDDKKKRFALVSLYTVVQYRHTRYATRTFLHNIYYYSQQRAFIIILYSVSYFFNVVTLCRIPTAARRECISSVSVYAGTSIASPAGARDLYNYVVIIIII
jgi:hypothetical protein